MLPIVKEIRKKSRQILNLARRYETPFYLIDNDALKEGIRDFKTAFDAHLPGHKAFYAVKANYHPHILKTVVKHGLGLDVSSGRELELGIKAGAKQMIFSGPGKTDAELRLALKHSSRVIVNLDSFGELDRLGTLAKKNKVRAGVRFFSNDNAWPKFGIPLRDLKKFWKRAKKYPNIDLAGLQFHTSNNLSSKPYQHSLRDLALYLKKHFQAEDLRAIKFIDIGGGFYPDRAEGYYPGATAYSFMQENKKITGKYTITRAASPKQYARDIAHTITKELDFLDCDYYTEPGRIITNNSTHIITRIADVKDGMVILDGGINMVGWEFGQHFYFPIMNLSDFSEKEKALRVYGPLCTPRDIWGRYIHAKKNTSGDVIVIPNQGAYKYALAQNYIKPIPQVLVI